MRAWLAAILEVVLLFAIIFQWRIVGVGIWVLYQTLGYLSIKKPA